MAFLSLKPVCAEAAELNLLSTALTTASISAGLNTAWPMAFAWSFQGSKNAYLPAWAMVGAIPESLV
ncbi:Uncharacterised protein [Mycobacteroides abscessus]|nr:Uncharacterised protein [Mycobacteroides abscessus]